MLSVREHKRWSNLYLLYSDITTDSSGTIWSKTVDTCDAFGHATEVDKYVNSSTYVKTFYHFNDPGNGLLTQVTDPNGNVTAYSNFTCGGAFPETTNVAGITTTTAWNVSVR